MSQSQKERPIEKRPIFFGASVVTFILSFVFQIYFFVILSGVLAEKENATDVIQAVIEWLLLLSPSLTLATIFFSLFLICFCVSWYRRESTHRYLIPFGVIVTVDAIIFLLVFAFGYQ